MGVARASLEELLLDYQDYLRQNRLPLWGKGHIGAREVRGLCYRKNRSYMTYKTYIENSPPETAANAMICLIHQTNYCSISNCEFWKKSFWKKAVLLKGFTGPGSRCETAKGTDDITGRRPAWVKRFPSDFMFELTKEESRSLRSQFVTLKRGQIMAL